MPIRGRMIRLGQLLKLAGVIDSGAEVKAFLSTAQVCWIESRQSSWGRGSAQFRLEILPRGRRLVGRARMGFVPVSDALLERPRGAVEVFR